MLHDISNKVRNTTDPLTHSSGTSFNLSAAVALLTMSLSTILLTSTQTLDLKHWLSNHMGNREILHNPEEEARKRELDAQGINQLAIPSAFELLHFYLQYAVSCFLGGALCAMLVSGLSIAVAVQIIIIAILFVWHFAYQYIFRGAYTPLSIHWFMIFTMVRTWTKKSQSFLHEDDLDPEIVHVGISNRLFTHTTMDPNNFSIFIQLSAFQSSIHDIVSSPLRHGASYLRSYLPCS